MSEVNNGIKSKQRVAEFGEVFTPENIVNDMLDLVKDESYKLESTFLEPACGNGNFLVKILSRKLETALGLSVADFPRNVFIAVSSIYGIDIQLDNVKESKDRMMQIIRGTYEKETGYFIEDDNPEFNKALQYILDTNIIWGNALTGLQEKDKKDIIIAEWNIVDDTVERKDYAFRNLTEAGNILYNTAEKEYEKVNYWDVHKAKEKKSGDHSLDAFFAEFGL